MAQVIRFQHNTTFTFITSNPLPPHSRTHGIARICKFDAHNAPHKRTILVYMIPCQLPIFQQVLAQIQNILTHQPHHAAPELQDLHQFHIICLPTLFGCFDVILEEEGLYGFVQLHRFNWDFLPLDTNVLSLEMPQLFAEVFVRGETALLTACAQSVRIMQMVFGQPAVMMSYGAHAENVMKTLLAFGSKAAATTSSSSKKAESSAFDAFVVIDRSCDWPSCLLTPVTYSGLLLEVFPSRAGTLSTDAANNRVRNGQLEFLRVEEKKVSTDASAAGPSTSSGRPSTSASGGGGIGGAHLRLNGTTDAIYRDNAYRHFSAVVQLLGQQAKQIGSESGQLQSMQLTDMQQYVNVKLPQLAAHKRELCRHVALCETIVREFGADFESTQNLQDDMLRNDNRKQSLAKVEEQLAIAAHRTAALRQICLMHLTCGGGGLSYEEATTFVRNYLNAFGHSRMLVFVRLAEMGLFADLDAVSKIAQKLATLNTLHTFVKKTAFQQQCGWLGLLPPQGEGAGGDESAANSKSAGSSSSKASASKTPTDGEQQPPNNNKCPSYVFNGSYIPLIAQLAKLCLSATRFEDFARSVVQTNQLRVWRYAQRTETVPTTGNGRHPADYVADVKAGVLPDLWPLRKRTIWLHILGGVTMAELAACDLVGKLCGATVVVSSDRVAGGDDWMTAVLDDW